ncbi:MAG TPA: hypothetical protein VHM70_22740 [Polyangiaceae bacterium]|nr:hypothetical protein [Polyangiaceae bacterium]
MLLRRLTLLWPLCLKLVFGLGVLGVALEHEAHAQTILPLTPSAFSRNQPSRRTTQKPFWINRADCLADDVLHFQIKVMGVTDYNFEVWIGDKDCSQKPQRIGSLAECWQVYKESAPSASFTVDLKVRDIVSKHPATGQLSKGTIDDCNDNWASSLGFYFMYVDDTGDVASNNVVWQNTGVDIKGPLPPSDVHVGIGNEELVAHWKTSGSVGLVGYNLYCSGVLGTEVTPSPAASSSAFTPISSTPTNSSPIDGGPDAGNLLDASTASAASDLLDAASPASSVPYTRVLSPDGGVLCEGAIGLVPGQLPPEELKPCGSETSKTATSGYAGGLVNGNTYAVAVAAIDELGNPGELSNLACGVPEYVDDFFPSYKSAGGGGGGGICSFSPIEQTTGSPATKLRALLGLGLVLVLGRLRRSERIRQ